MILMIDNYDSFTYNLVQYLEELGAEVVTHRNDKITIEQIKELSPEKIVISPGPCTPKEAGISVGIVKKLGEQTPILGVCLGHQCIGEAYGGEVVRAERIMHGKTSEVTHDNTGVFRNLDNPFVATRYHSLIVKRETLPDCFTINATTEREDEIMGFRHNEYPLHGVQFHPESILTDSGKQLLNNFLKQ